MLHVALQVNHPTSLVWQIFYVLLFPTGRITLGPTVVISDKNVGFQTRPDHILPPSSPWYAAFSRLGQNVD